MNTKKLGIIILALSLGFFAFHCTLAENSEGIIITEIMYDPEGSDNKKEWIEVFNNTKEKVDLEEWVLIESSDEVIEHKIKNEKSEGLESGEYGIIAENSQEFLSGHSDFNGIIYDSSFSLGNNGEEIILKNIKNNKEVVVEYFKEMGANGNGYSLEWEDDWRESYVLGGTPGGENSQKQEVVEYKKTIRINELFPDPKNKPEGDYEFIELYNYGEDEINLSGWFLVDEDDNEFELEGVINKGKYLSFFNMFSLNNDNDEIILKNPNKEVVDVVDYKDPQEGFSYSFNKDIKKWTWSTFVTPGEENRFEDEEVEESKKYNKEIKINEIFPNPEDDEGENEFIELYNYSNKDVDLENWILKDLSKNSKYIFPKIKIKAKNYLSIYRSDFKFALNNSGKETVYLINPNNEIANSVNYEYPEENISYGLDNDSKKWRWSKFLTPGEKNKFDKIPDIKIKIDKNIYTDIYTNFGVEAGDVDGSNLEIKWDFGDGETSYKEKVRHKYEKKGNYQVKTIIFNGSEIFEFKNSINIKEFPSYDVEIVSFMPNPKGVDAENEWIEIKNKSKNKINIKDWSVAVGVNKNSLVNHLIAEDFYIKPGKNEKITRKHLYFSLNNKSGYIEIRYPNGKKAFGVGYNNDNGVEDDSIYKNNKNGEWVWILPESIKNTEKITTNNKNITIKTKSEEISEEIVKDEMDNDDNEVSGDVIGMMSKVFINKNKDIFGFYGLKSELINIIWEGKIGIREENGIYYFNPRIKSEKHYLIRFWENLF